MTIGSTLRTNRLSDVLSGWLQLGRRALRQVGHSPKRKQERRVRAANCCGVAASVAGVAKQIALGLVGGASVPFLVTGFYRATPMGVPTATPFVLIAVTATVLAFLPRWRAVAAGLFVGAAAYAAFLYWLLLTWGRGLQNF